MDKANSSPVDKTYPDALTNLFVGIFAGNILFSIQKIHFFEINLFSLNNILLLMNELIYLVYLIFGYFTLFRVYHRDSIFFKKSYNHDEKELIKYKFTALALVIALLALVPNSFSLESSIKFYPILCFILVFDMVWIYFYSRISNDAMNSNELSLGYIFDASGIFVSLFTFSLLLEWQSAEKILGNNLFCLITILLHIAYFSPFISLYIRHKKI